MSTPLDYAGKLPIAKRKRSWRWLWITILCATLIVSLLFTYPTYRRSRAIRAVTSAKNAAEEAKAFILVQRTNEQYEIDFYDAAGMEIRPYVNGDYASVKSVKIIWPNGASASAPVRDQRNLIILMTD